MQQDRLGCLTAENSFSERVPDVSRVQVEHLSAELPETARADDMLSCIC